MNPNKSPKIISALFMTDNLSQDLLISLDMANKNEVGDRSKAIKMFG